jgi:hypothetical protein
LTGREKKCLQERKFRSGRRKRKEGVNKKEEQRKRKREVVSLYPRVVIHFLLCCIHIASSVFRSNEHKSTDTNQCGDGHKTVHVILWHLGHHQQQNQTSNITTKCDET